MRGFQASHSWDKCESVVVSLVQNTRASFFCSVACWESGGIIRDVIGTIHNNMYRNHLLKYKAVIAKAKTGYYASVIGAAEGNTRTLFSTLNNILRPPDIFASHVHSTALCNKFINFFTGKIIGIHNQLPPPCTSTDCKHCSILAPPLISTLSNFDLPTSAEISTIIQKSKSSTCSLDPLPTNLVKLCLPSLLPLITDILHSSLSSGSVPPPLKSAIITLILKKPGLDPNDLNNFRPISNLPFMSKILEKVVAAQVHDHLIHNTVM